MSSKKKHDITLINKYLLPENRFTELITIMQDSINKKIQTIPANLDIKKGHLLFTYYNKANGSKLQPLKDCIFDDRLKQELKNLIDEPMNLAWTYPMEEFFFMKPYFMDLPKQFLDMIQDIIRNIKTFKTKKECFKYMKKVMCLQNYVKILQNLIYFLFLQKFDGTPLTPTFNFDEEDEYAAKMNELLDSIHIAKKATTFINKIDCGMSSQILLFK